MSDMFKIIHEKLMAKDDDDIDILCLGYFRAVYEQFTENTTKKTQDNSFANTL